MGQHKRAFWCTVLVAIAFLAFSKIAPVTDYVGKPLEQWLTWGSYALLAVGGLCLAIAYFVSPSEVKSVGGNAGSATASGDKSTARGGSGGSGKIGQGGDGGDALASGRGSYAEGGKGGDG